MRRTPLFIAAASMLMVGAGLAFGQTSTTTTTTWSDADGNILRQESTTHNYNGYVDPSLHAEVGVEVPHTVTLYPLPPAVAVPGAGTYSYGIINNNPVVVERTTRRVVHTWE
jgi:hypothetical protein